MCSPPSKQSVLFPLGLPKGTYQIENYGKIIHNSIAVLKAVNV